MIETGISQVTPLEVNTSKAGNLEANILQIGSAEINSAQGTPSQIRPSQVDTSQVGSFERNISVNTTFQIDSWKVSLPSSITPQQLTGSFNLFDSHNPNLQNTTVPTWTDSIQTSTPFDLKLEVSNLPTGKLAEAQITSFDTSGMPSAGTIFIDDANGKGWFIDSTPLNNSGFASNNAAKYFQADVNSAA